MAASPTLKRMVGINGALFNLCGNMAGVTTPPMIGAIVERTHSYSGALIFVGLIALCAIASYGPVAGEMPGADGRRFPVVCRQPGAHCAWFGGNPAVRYLIW